MSHFVVSARKYRPDSFDTVVGQKHITQTLVNEIKNDRLAQAFLFCGPRGVGKTTCARILAKEINKDTVPEDYDYSYNIFELDAASHNSVDDIRSLNEQVRIPPQTGEYKVYIIDEVHMLSQAAFNAFLKTLEEPPSYAIFILATTERHKILPTILSRCQIFNFDRIQVQEMVEHLKRIAQAESIEVEDEALHLIAQKADGALRDALSIFDQMASFGAQGKITYDEVIHNLNILDYDYYFKITDGFVEGNVADVLLIYDQIQQRGFDGQLFINGLANHFRDLLVAKNSATRGLIEKSVEMASRYERQANLVTTSFLINAINILGETDVNYKSSRNQRLHVELALIKLASLQHAIDVTKKKKPRIEAIVKLGYFASFFKLEEKQSTQTHVESIPEDVDASTIVRIGSISEALKPVKAKVETTSVVSNADKEEVVYKAITNEVVKEQFSAYAAHLITLGKRGLSSYFIDPVFKVHENEVALVVGSKTLQRDIEANEVGLINFFKKVGYQPAFSYAINAEEVSAYKLFTPKQQFDAMAKEHPILKQFEEGFGLDFDA